MVSHSMNALKRVCNRSIWIHKGRIVMDGKVDDVTEQYKTWSGLMSDGKKEKANAMLLDIANAYEPDIFTVTHTPPSHTGRHFSQ